jgi:hypothetical protein
MPKSKLIKANVPRLYQKQATDYIFYGMIKGIRITNPNISIEDSVFNTLEYYQLHNTFDPETVKAIYHQIDKLLLENKGL